MRPALGLALLIAGVVFSSVGCDDSSSGEGGGGGTGGLGTGGTGASSTGGSATGGSAQGGAGGSASVELKAFPSAKGAGADATGGRGGRVIHVTTLDWSAPGGLREAITTAEPRIIVFDVSGEIDATAETAWEAMIVGSEYNDMTIAGQSAPEGGISIRTSEFSFNDVDNIVIRYLRFRATTGSAQDTVSFVGTSDVVVDHCTISHGGDEAFSITASATGKQFGNATLQRSFIQDSKTGSIMGDCTGATEGDFTIVDNLWSGVSHRFPNICGRGRYDAVNNVVYNHKWRTLNFNGVNQTNVLNNYFKPSANGLRQSGYAGTGSIADYMYKVDVNDDSEHLLIHAAGTYITGERTSPMPDDRDLFTAFVGSTVPEGDPVPDRYFVDSAYSLAGKQFTVKSAEQAYDDVLQDVGANKYLNADGSVGSYLDPKDAADIEMVRSDTYDGSFYTDWNLIPHPTVPTNVRASDYDTDRDGMPDAWEQAHGLDANVDDSAGDRDSDGYTNVEEFLNQVDF